MIHLLSLTPAIDELLALDALEVGQHYRARLVGRQAAGKATNVARTLGHLGVPCRLVGLVGAGEAAFFRESFAELPVRCELVAVPAVTRRSVTMLVGTEEAHVAYQSFAVSRAQLAQVRERLVAELQPGDLVAASGLQVPGLEPSALAELLTTARRAGARLYVDGAGPALAEAIAVHPDGVRINAAELGEWLELAGLDVGGRTEEGVRALLRAGVGTAMVSLGAEGAWLGRSAELLHAKLAVPGPAHAVGAGDAQLAGWLAALASGAASLAEELQLAMGTAAARLRHQLPGVVVSAEAHGLAREVVIADGNESR